jgi:hypothetical protein
VPAASSSVRRPHRRAPGNPYDGHALTNVVALPPCPEVLSIGEWSLAISIALLGGGGGGPRSDGVRIAKRSGLRP